MQYVLSLFGSCTDFTLSNDIVFSGSEVDCGQSITPMFIAQSAAGTRPSMLRDTD